MSTPETTGPDNRWIYWGIAVILIALAIFGLIAYDAKQDDQEAQAKAQELTQKLEAAGLTPPADLDIFVGPLGNDGGAVCDNPAQRAGQGDPAPTS